MIITTSRRHEEQLYDRAKQMSKQLNKPFIKREDRSVQQLISTYQKDVFVVSKERLSLHSKRGGEPFFYHPNAAMPRGKAFLRTNYDPLVEVAKLEKGDLFLDCTLGLAADSLIAKLAVGKEGKVVGLEAHEGIAVIVKDGLQTWRDGDQRLLEAMREIEVVYRDHLSYLLQLPDRSFDVVYFDPMFDQTVPSSLGLEGLRVMAIYDDLSHDVINEAKRVARKRVVLKDHWQSERFKTYEFQVKKRKSALFHYGFIEIT